MATPRRFPAFWLALLVCLIPAAASAQERQDWDIPNGHFFTQTGGGQGLGYAVTDEGSVPFWSEFQRVGGVAAAGYPISQRFEWDGFVVQAFQRVVFQWRPELGRVAFVNVFDRLDAAGANERLLATRQVPLPKEWDDTGLSWDEIARRRLAVLDASPPIREAYFAVVGDPVQANGLPTSEVVNMGNHDALRAQRAVFQLWKEEVAWARKGQVTVALGGEIAREAGLFPDSDALRPVAATAVQAAAATEPAGGPQVLAYYMPWTSTSWESLTRAADAIDYLSGHWLWMDGCGGLGSRDDQTLKAFARAHGIRVLPSLGSSSAWLSHRLLTDEPTTKRAIDQIVAYVLEEGYDGFDLDLEGVDAGDREAYTAFVARLAGALHEHGKILALAIPAKTRDVTTGWAGAYDYAALDRHADLVTIMSYDFHGAWGEPGPVAPYDWIERVAAFATSQIQPSKVMLGLAFYGYDWNVTSGHPVHALTHRDAQWLSERYGVALAQEPTSRSATLRYQAPWAAPRPPRAPQTPLDHVTTGRTPPPCSVAPPTPPPGPTPTPRPTPPPEAIQEHVVWFEDAASAAARLELAGRYGTGGVAAWALGQEDPGVWAILRGRRNGE